jgi:hypothetical protein
MPMTENDKTMMVVRILGALAGLVGGAAGGTLLLLLMIAVTGSTFGLSTIWPGTLAGAFIGLLLGFFFPKIGLRLTEILNGF